MQKRSDRDVVHDISFLKVLHDLRLGKKVEGRNLRHSGRTLRTLGEA